MMEYKILYPEAFPVVECSLRHGEAIKAESDAMIAMDATVDVEGKMEGGVLGGIMRRVFTGESFFLQRLVASRGAGRRRSTSTRRCRDSCRASSRRRASSS